jgi:hypothetical protein
MDSLQEWWLSVMDVPGARWIIWGSLLAALVLTAFYVVQYVRNLAIGGSSSSHDYLGEFRKMRDEGKLADSEFKKLAGLVPLPEIDSKKPETVVKGTEGLTQAAKEIIQKTAKSDVDVSPSSDDAAGGEASDP